MRSVEYLTERELAELSRVDPRPFITRLIVLAVLAAGSVSLILFVPGLPGALGVVLAGLLFAHAVELQHQCLHGSAFVHSGWNRAVGVVLGLPMLVSFSEYQVDHMRHHRNLGTPNDREFFNYDYGVLSTWRAFAVHLAMVPHLAHVVPSLLKAPFRATRSDTSPKVANRIRGEYVLMDLLILAAVTAALTGHARAVLQLWVLPLLVSIPVHALIELPEHYGCDHGTQDVLVNTRSIKAGRLALWLTNGNNFHVEHHLYPGIPNDRWAALHGRLQPGMVAYEPSYWAFYRRFFRNLVGSKRSDRPVVASPSSPPGGSSS